MSCASDFSYGGAKCHSGPSICDSGIVSPRRNARTAVMGAQQAATTMRIVAEDRAERQGQILDEDFVNAFVDQIVGIYEPQENAFVTSGRSLDDGMIDPRDTRNVLGFLLATVDEGDRAEVNPLTFGVARP
ncbi:MAG: carboxyl transferase domain-containing protein [Nitriliruptorales bacterium]|nr:carboxyl transferase domain-containing protein [Nitriliruptorales bacterium]